MNKHWWQRIVAYQIYPKSFLDTDGDGIGNLAGITQKLDYLKELGIDLIWICPMFRSPMDDNGYDISDYYRVNPMFGSDEEMQILLDEAKKRGIGIILDLVVNHCSDEHAWFQKALRDPDCEEAGYFYFLRPEDGQVPNNWRSNFGGSAWTPVGDGRYYLHTFSKRQPDLNWENPLLREKIYEMINWWLQRGIAGFRVDAITFIKKDLTFQSREPVDAHGRYPIEAFENYPGIGEFLTELRDRTFAAFDCMTVAEAPGVPYEQLPDYAGENGYFSMIFDFSYTDMNRHLPDWSIGEFKRRVVQSQLSAEQVGWNAVFLENHDQPRSLNKYISKEDIGIQSGRMLATLLLTLRGTPFIYEGEEIGMTNSVWHSIDDFDDISARQQYQERIEAGQSPEEALTYFQNIGRDNARTPMQWDHSPNGGFSTVKPWLKSNPNYPEINVSAQLEEPDSLLSWYRQLIVLRKSETYGDVLIYGSFLPLENLPEPVFGYLRKTDSQTIAVLCSFSNQAQQVTLPFIPKKSILAAPILTPAQTMTLAPYQAAIFTCETK